MNLIEIAFWLKKTPLFESLTLDELLTLSSHFEMVEFKKSQMLFTPGLEATRLFLLMEGNVSILDGGGSPLATLSPPDYFGEESLFSKHKRRYSAQALTSVKLLALMGSHFISIINQCPSVALSLLCAYAESVHFRPHP